LVHRLYISIVSLVLIFALTACRDGQSKKSNAADSDVQSLSDASVSASGLEWKRVVSGLPEAVLSIWSNDQDEVWLCGADSDSSMGPLILRKKGNRWTRYLSGFEGDLWWVFGVGDSRYFVGESGLFLRHQVGTEIFERIETGTQATLYGVWGASEDILWLVGGFVSPENGEGVLLKMEDGLVRSVTDLPKSVSPTAAFFKVWQCCG